MRRWRIPAIALFFLVVGILLGRFGWGDAVVERAGALGERAVGLALGTVARTFSGDVRLQILAENPDLLAAIRRGGSFGGTYSVAVARGMFSRDPEAIEDVREGMEVIELAPRTFHLRMPIVNATLFETDEGLVLVDTGMAPAGPALLEAIRGISDKPLHTIIYTHGHVDHAYGTWALLEGTGESPQIIAQENLPARFDRYLRMRGSLARYMSQPLETLPQKPEDLVWPTRTFRDRLDLEIGGETFILFHYPAETDDQLFVWVPGRKVMATADYYQGFLPNAGNGKRVQRYVESWVEALREMVSLEPEILIPGHGAAISDPALIRENLTVLADTLQFIVDHTIAGLNAGLRKDQIHGSLELPEKLANHPTMTVQYVNPEDISKMVLRQYTGWWDDVPSHWTPAPLEKQAEVMIEMAGGLAPFAARARALMTQDLQLASHLADFAYLAYPGDPTAQALAYDVYRARILDPASNTQEIVAYLDVMTDVRVRQQATE